MIVFRSHSDFVSHRRVGEVPSFLALAGLLLAAALGCADRAPSASTQTTASDSAGIRIVVAAQPPSGSSAVLLVDAAPALTIGAEEGEAEYEFFRVSDAVRLPDGRIVVANSGTSELRVFDSTGRFMARVGRGGAGPGEFGSYPIRLHYVGGELLASDAEAARLHVFDSSLALIETRRFTLTPEVPRPQLRGLLADGAWLATAFDSGGALRGPPGSVITTRFAITLFDSRGEFLRRFGQFSGRPRYVNTVGETTHYPHLPLTVDAVVRPFGNQVLVVRGDRPEVELWNTDGTLSALLRWPRERPLASEWYPRYRELAIASLATANERNRRLYGAFYAKDLPLPEYAAMYENALVDSALRIWLLRYRLPGEDGDPQWDVLDESGRWLGVVSTPLGLEVFRISGDHLMGQMRDSLGVERVVLHRLRVAP